MHFQLRANGWKGREELRLRVGEYRVLYTLDHSAQVLTISAVGHRRDVYRRLKTVHREINPLYHQLISAFCSLTSVPLVLNTSFNENELVVCRPEEALACFLRPKMDVLVIGSFFVERHAKMEVGSEKIAAEVEAGES